MNIGNYEKAQWKKFCVHYYTENCVERHQIGKQNYKNVFRYVRKNYDFLNREWNNKKDNWLSMGEVS